MKLSMLKTFIPSSIFAAAIVAIASPLSGFAGTSGTITDDIPLIAIGPISKIDLASNTITVNGQRLIFDSQTSTHTDGSSSQGIAGLALLNTTDYVQIGGDVMDPGLSLATSVEVLNESYVEGSSAAYVRAIIGKHASSIGHAYSGQSVIDYTSALSTSLLSNFSENDVVEFAGTSVGGTFLASSTTSISENYSCVTAGRGSGTRAGRGSGTRAGRGSGTRADDESGVLAGRGSGTRAGRGSGTRAGRGSGTRAGRGSGTR